jgi:hypothetical protein
MREEAADLWSWLGKGAHFYVCGDAKRMAADVDATFVQICAEHGQMDAAAGDGGSSRSVGRCDDATAEAAIRACRLNARRLGEGNHQ